MPRMIEIDDQVYQWLQEHAHPFEDTPNSVLRRAIGLDEKGTPGGGDRQASPEGPLGPPPVARRTRRGGGGGRRKLNERALRDLGVSHFVVGGEIPSYRGDQPHPRAYLDAMLDKGFASFRYFERWSEQGLPNPRGDAASRVILKVGVEDTNTRVCFHDGREMVMSEFIKAFLGGTL